MGLFVCVFACLQLHSNQSFYGYGMSVGKPDDERGSWADMILIGVYSTSCHMYP